MNMARSQETNSRASRQGVVSAFICRPRLCYLGAMLVQRSVTERILEAIYRL
jgi:hypothetical protein